MAAAPSAQARVTLQDAFERFASTVAPDDKRLFHNTQLKDVRNEAIRIERQLRARRTQRCMARLDNFLRGMEHYSKVVEVLCNGTPFLPWIWAPVKLMLMITADSISAFEKLIEAYGKIGDIVSRLDRLGDALVNDHNFQNVLALVYSDIVEFHRRAYKFVKRKSWSIFFSSMWAGFESRFNGILKNLAYHTELADKEAAAADIAESVRRSKADDENWEQQEREWTAVKIQKVLAWLGTTDILPADLLDRHLRDYLPHSCDWFIQHEATDLWLGDSAKNPLLWLCGKPGAGKSMICSALVQHTETNAVHVFYYFCSFLGSRSDGPSRLLRSLISQVIQKHQDLAIYVHDVYFKSNPEPTKKALLTLLPELLRGLGSVRLIVDGIDEWASRDQKELLNDLSQMISTDKSSHICKILVASRDTIATSRRKKDKLSTMISLSNGVEGLAVTRAIASFVDDKLADLPEHFEELDPDSSIMAHVKKTLLEKSQGMFLWVSLVLQSLDTVYSPEELRTIVDNLPSDLEALYKQIMTRLCSAPGAQSYGGVPRIMSWVCFSRRPLHKSELLQALSMFPDDMGSQMRSIPVASILDHCKPLIEELPDSMIVPVHFSVKEYFLKAQIPQILPAIDVALDISCACAIVIMRGLELVRLGSNYTDHLALIASGNYRLLPYALEFWIEHCLQYGSGKDIRPGRHFQRQLDRLHGTHENYLHALGLAATQNVSPDRANTTHAEERLNLFLNIPIYGLMANVLRLRQLVSQLDGDNSSDIETYVINNDRTLFSRLAYTYERAIVHLLAQKEVQGIAPATLRAFQESYASTAFRCRFPHCERLSSGFATSQLRLEHETIHFQRVYCQTMSCQFNRIGFGKRSALNAHTRKYHAQSNVLLIPAKVRRITDVASKPEEPQQNLQGPSMDLPQADRIAAAEQLLRTSPGIIRYMDSERFPPDALNAQIRQNLPPGVMSWAQLKAWAQGNPTHTPGLDAQRITMLQVLHHQDREREQQKSGGVEGTHIPSNAQETPTPQQNRQDQVIINQFAKKLMDTAKPEVIQKFETDVGRWPDDKKQQLLDQGINPLFFRFRQHAEMLYKRGGPNKAGAVNTGAQNDILHQVASNDSSSQGLNPSAASIQETGAMSRDPSEPYSNFQTRTRTDVPDFDGYARVLPEAYLNMSGTHVAPSTQPKNTTVDELLSPFRRSSPYISDQDSFEKDNPAPLSSRPADDNTNRVDMTSLENFDFDQFLKGDPGYDSAALQSRSQSPAIYGHISTRSPGFNNAAAEPDLQEQARLYYEQLYLLEYQNKKLLKPSGERWPWMAEKDNLPDGPPMQQQQRIPYGTQQTNQEREQRQEVQQHRDESVVIETQSPVTRREIDNDSGYVVLTQAQKDQMYQEQLALLEKQNHKRLLQKWQDEDQEQKTQEERWRHERLMRQQQRARQQNEDDLASYAVPDQPGYAGVSQNPNTQSSPFTGWNTPHLDRSHHPPQLPPNLERYLEHPDQYSESTFEQLQSQHRPYGSAQLPKVNTTQPLYPGPRPDMYRIDAGPSPPTSQQRPRDTHGSLDSEEPETAHGHLPGKVRYGRKLEGVPSPEERPPEPIWSPYNESRKLLDGDPLPELDHEGIALNRERPRYRSAGAHESPPLDYTPQPLNALPWPDRYGPLGPLQPSWAELERYSPKGGFQQSDGPPPPLPPPRVLSQLRKPSNRNDWAAAVQASRHDSFPAQAQRPSLPAPQDEPRSTTDTGGIPPNRLTYGSPSPRRDDPHDIPAYVNTWQPPDPAQVREELQLYGEMNRRVQAQGLPSTNRPTPEMLRAGWGHRSTLTRRV